MHFTCEMDTSWFVKDNRTWEKVAEGNIIEPEYVPFFQVAGNSLIINSGFVDQSIWKEYGCTPYSNDTKKSAQLVVIGKIVQMWHVL